MLRQIIGVENPVIVEIGAHYGEDSMRFLETFENPTIYCFEPDPRNIKVFKKHINHPNIVLCEFALSNINGSAEFFQSYDPGGQNNVPEKYDWISFQDYKIEKLSNSGSSSLKRGYKKTLQESVEVETRRFDTWCEDNNVDFVDFVWIDVQGAERDVILGMGDAIRSVKYIWMEYGEALYEDYMDRSDTINFMRERMFEEVPQLSNTHFQGDILFINKGVAPQ